MSYMFFLATALLVLTNLAEATSFHGSSQTTNRFDFVGIVDNISSLPSNPSFNFTDTEGHYARFVCTGESLTGISEGDLIRVTGNTFSCDNPLKWRAFGAEKIELLEHREYAPYSDTTKLTGTLAAVVDKDPEWLWLVLRTADGRKGIVANRSNYPFSWLVSLVDAEVEVSGIPYHTVGLYGAIVPHFSIRGKDSIKILKTAPADPFDAPPFSAINLLHRQVLVGTVLGTTADRFALYCHAHFTLIVLLGEDQPPPRPYETVEVSGFVSSAPNVIMDNAVYRRSVPQPEKPLTPPLPSPESPNSMPV